VIAVVVKVEEVSFVAGRHPQAIGFNGKHRKVFWLTSRDASDLS
jgi:hypothetical protein